MPNDLSDEQIQFLTEYVGVTFPDTTTAPALLPLWQKSKDQIDDQLRTLSDQLRRSGIAEVQAVADQVETLLLKVRVRLPAALREFDADPQSAKARKILQGAIKTARDWLDSDGRVAAIDTNPWNVPVSVATTLGTCLDRLEDRLNAEGERAA